jgi:hypothetical protein
MRFVSRITTARIQTDTPSECFILTAFLRQQWLRERATNVISSCDTLLRCTSVYKEIKPTVSTMFHLFTFDPACFTLIAIIKDHSAQLEAF